MERTFLICGRGSEISTDYFPPVVLRRDVQYVIGLVSFGTYNTIPNILTGYNNRLKFHGVIPKPSNEIFPKPGSTSTVVSSILVPQGNYEIEQIAQFLIAAALDKGVKLQIVVNKHTFRTRVKCDHAIEFSGPDSVGKCLGFTHSVVLEPGIWHDSPEVITVSPVSIVRINCNIVRGSYMNGQECHTLFSFYPQVPAGFRIDEAPDTVIYLPTINNHLIQNLTISFVDQRGEAIDFLNEEVTVVLHLKPFM
jgi:hypothetical protein